MYYICTAEMIVGGRVHFQLTPRHTYSLTPTLSKQLTYNAAAELVQTYSEDDYSNKKTQLER